MAINYQPSGFEGIAEILSQLGAVAGNARYGQELQGQRRRDETLANPELLQFLAPMLQGNPEAARAYGLEGLGAFVEQLQPTFQQSLDRARGPELVQATVAGDVAEQRARPAVAEARVATAGAEKELGAFNEALYSTMRAQDVPQIQAQLARTQADLGIDAANQQREAYAKWAEILPTLPQHMQEAASAAIANPGFLQHMQLHEQMSLQERLARLQASMAAGRGQMNPLDLLSFNLKLNDELRTAVDRFNEAKTDDQKTAARAEVTRLSQMQSQVMGPNSSVIVPRIRRSGFIAGVGNALGRDWGNREQFLEILQSGTIKDQVLSGLVLGSYAPGQLMSGPVLQNLAQTSGWTPTDSQEVIEAYNNWITGERVREGRERSQGRTPVREDRDRTRRATESIPIQMRN